MLIKLKRGFDLPIAGPPEQVIHAGPPVSTVALMGVDHEGLRPSLAVGQGDRVRLGQIVFTDRKHPPVRYTAPGAGRILAINTGARRRIVSVVIELEGEEEETFSVTAAEDPRLLEPGTVRETLLASGLWTALRTRPHGRVPGPDRLPDRLFVTAMDTNPLAGDPAVIIAERKEAFWHGLTVLSRLGAEATYLCAASAAAFAGPEIDNLIVVEIQGRHPAGLPGTHMDLLGGPVENGEAWYLGYQDVIAIGELFRTGRLSTERVVALSGPGMERPRLVRTRLGASLEELLAGEARPGCRVISGPVLSGRAAVPSTAYLGRYHQQVTALPEHHAREPAAAFPGMKISARITNTALNGWPSGMLPTEAFDRVWPLRVPPAPLLRALLTGDTETARALGCLGLEEEDLALCSYVCPAKYDYGSALRRTLRELERSR